MEPNRSFDDYVDALRRAGQFLTVQRRTLLRYLLQHQDHPTTAAITDAVAGEARTASVATVYNNLALFAQLGLLRCVRGPSGEAHWDIRTDVHHHLSCTTCGAVDDVDGGLAEVVVRDPELRSRIERSEVWLVGKCRRCAKACHNGPRDGAADQPGSAPES